MREETLALQQKEEAVKAKTLNEMAVKSGSRLLTWLNTATMTPASTRGRLPAVLGIAGILLLACMSGNVLAARKVCDDGGYPPCNDKGGEESAGNRLSYPAILPGGESIAPFFTVAEDSVEGAGLSETWSYGCDVGETTPDEQYSYPNTSCVDSLASPGVYLTADECTLEVDAKCHGYQVYRIYWQKEELNDWSAQVTGIPVDAESLPVTVRYVDWGDSIESVSWNERSILRVETQPFVDLSVDPLSELGDTQTQLGFQMWHVSGQGTTEQWGVRFDDFVTGLPYAYQSPYAIINGGTADLYLSKLFSVAADDEVYGCPSSSGDDPPEYPPGYPDGGNFVRTFLPSEGWSDACNMPLVPYTVEQSVSGKFVHGFNWRMRDYDNPLPSDVCGEDPWQKTGWWRLTFVPNGGATKMVFDAATATSAPVVPGAEPTDLTLLAEEEEETLTSLYAPLVDVDNNLTYIDICIVKKTKGGR